MAAPTVHGPDEAKGEYREMLLRLMTRQFYAETATAEVFGRSIGCAPTLRDKFLAAEFAREEADHSERLCKLFRELGLDPEEVHRARPPAAQFWSLDLDNWIHIAVFNFTVDRAGSQQIMEYRDSSYLPWAREMEAVLADEEGHYDNGVENLREFARDKHAFVEFQRLYFGMLPVTVKRAFGRPNGADNDYCIAVGLKRHTTEAVVNRYLAEMLGYMRPCGLKFPPLSAFAAVGAQLMPSTREIILSNQ
ncbi:MAG TPA: Phenylacetic acid catabolic protein [Stellaceae bacterium]|nr:Phenylacetic acid catabolic protein [Stellaceae bacterium]